MSDSQPGHAPSIGLLLLFLAITLNLFDRQVIYIVAQDMKLDLRLSDAELGLLTGAAFGLFKAAVSIPFAWSVDRLNRARLIAAMVLAWSGCTFLCGFAVNFAGLFLARAGVGVGESCAVPATTALARDYFPDRPTSALALMMAGNPFGTFLAFLIGGTVAAIWGWRAAFVVAGVPGLILSIVIFLKLQEMRPSRPIQSSEDSLRQSLAAILKRPSMWALICATCASMTVVAVSIAWVPAFFLRTHHLRVGEMAIYGAIAVGFGGGLGTLVGLLCEQLRERIDWPESIVMLTTMLLLLPAVLSTVLTRDSSAALLGYFLLNTFAFAWVAPTTRLIQDSAGAHRRALAVALCSAMGTITSLVVAVPATGWVSDHWTASYGPRAIGYALSMTIVAALAVGLASHWVILRRLRSTDGTRSSQSAKLPS